MNMDALEIPLYAFVLAAPLTHTDAQYDRHQ